jgi:hypothetical protein
MVPAQLQIRPYCPEQLNYANGRLNIDYMTANALLSFLPNEVGERTVIKFPPVDGFACGFSLRAHAKQRMKAFTREQPRQNSSHDVGPR